MQKSVMIAVRHHLFPCRTQKLSSPTPKILAWRRVGKIGSCGHEDTQKRRQRAFSFGVYSSLAQSVEHAAVNRRVVGSSPTGGAKNREIFNLYVAFFRRRYIRDRVEYLSFVIISRCFTAVKCF